MSEVFDLNNYSFKIEGLRCIKCIRKVQSIASHFPSIQKMNVNLGDQLVTAQAGKDFLVEDFISELKREGFGVSPLAHQAQDTEIKKVNKKSLMKIGIAGACAGNIMLLSAAEYAGAQIEGWPYIFKIMSFLFTLPVVFYSAQPLYKGAWYSLRAKKISIDTPIILAVLGGFILSSINLIRSHESQTYFDSISMFVFFLLASRHIVQKIQSKFTRSVSTEDVFYQTRALLIKDKGTKAVNLEEIKKEDLISIPHQSYIAFDGYVASDKALIDDSFYSGEAYPKILNSMEKVFAGSKNIGPDFQMRVTKLPHDSRLSKIIDLLNTSLRSKTRLSQLADQGSQLLTVLILLSSVLVFGYFSFINIEEGINRVLALLVVACPCGLAIATPLVQTLGIKQALKKNLLIKDVSVFEDLREIDTVFFDKTGTLTNNNLEVSKVTPRNPTSFEKQIIYNLEKTSEHPLAQAIRKFTGEQKRLDLKNFEEQIGQGVSCIFQENHYSLKTSQESKGKIVFEKNSEPVLFFSCKETLDPGAQKVIQSLQQKTFIISGDKHHQTLKIANEIGIPESHIFAEKSPQEKAQIIKDHPGKVLYIGDGINDSLAMSHAQVSVSMQSSADVAFKSSQVHILKDGLSSLLSLFSISQTAYRSMQSIILISIIYNVLFAGFACAGLIHPLLAVIIMPLSSISITFIGLYLMHSYEESQ